VLVRKLSLTWNSHSRTSFIWQSITDWQGIPYGHIITLAIFNQSNVSKEVAIENAQKLSSIIVNVALDASDPSFCFYFFYYFLLCFSSCDRRSRLSQFYDIPCLRNDLLRVKRDVKHSHSLTHSHSVLLSFSEEHNTIGARVVACVHEYVMFCSMRPWHIGLELKWPCQRIQHGQSCWSSAFT